MKPIFKKTAFLAAQKAGAILKKNALKPKHIQYKGRIDLVTDIDKQSEKIIVQILTKAFPDHDILAEEGGGRITGSPYKWIIDPLDGTTNYAHAYPVYCVSIALEYKNKIILGLVYNPVMEEYFYAESGHGAYLNNKKIQVSHIKHIERALLVTGFPYVIRKNHSKVIKIFKNFLLSCQGIRRDGSAALNLCYVACGRLDGFWELNLNPWDTAAGFLIAQEAGARITDYKGNDYSCYNKDILASNGSIHTPMLKTIKKGRLF
ncbi:MAG: inositol monophosphatase family protein [Candidatus Ancaeobacter aquaticus]|nr:inositol monophosphatase family protein [Candidatus Ancaeobacter aquaticus]